MKKLFRLFSLGRSNARTDVSRIELAGFPKGYEGLDGKNAWGNIARICRMAHEPPRGAKL